MSRRKFLHLTGGSAALVIAGAAGALSEAAAKQRITVPTGITVERPTTLQTVTLGTDEKVDTSTFPAMRHGRHRRQFLDGVIDTPEDSYLNCERDCTEKFRAHEF